jgi:osmotically-inducible protein OsmY
MAIKTRSAASVLAALLAVSPLTHAADKPMAQELREARIEGQIAAAFALNRHLHLFDFDIEANGSTVILTGAVEESIDKDLAEQVAIGVEGVNKVDNRITVLPEGKVAANANTAEKSNTEADRRDFATTVEDATITASVKSQLLWNRHTDGLDINVDTHNAVVTLRGVVATSATRDLAGRLAENTDGVQDVRNKLDIAPGGADAVDKTKAALGKVGHTVSDSWITTRVKSSLLYAKNVDGSNIHVETRDGVVRLRGIVDSPAERDLAVSITKDIRGVRDVDAKLLKAEQDS